MPIVYVTQVDGSFRKSGDLAPGTRNVSIQIEDRKPSYITHSRKEAEHIIETAYLGGHVRYSSYTIVARADDTPKMSEETKEKLREINKKKRKDDESRD